MYLWNSAAAARMGLLLRCACRTWRPRWALEQEAEDSAWDFGVVRTIEIMALNEGLGQTRATCAQSDQSEDSDWLG